MIDRKLEWLEVMRGGAALWVLLHHAKQSVDYFVSEMGSQPWIEHGYLGVDFFFVLSGFIIAFASNRLAARGGTLRDYVSARLIRIYVPYLPVGIAIYLLYMMLPGLSEAERSPSLLTSLMLLPDNNPPALSVAWTLVHEIIFYGLYAVSFLNKRPFMAVLIIWVFIILAVAGTGVVLTPIARYFLAPLNLCFVLGVLIFQLNRRVQLGSRSGMTLAMIGLSIVGWQAMGEAPNRLVVDLGLGLGVWAAASPASTRRKVWRPIVVLGAASYAIYLIHNPALSLLVRLIPSGTDTGLAFALIAIGALVAGVVYWWLYERPMLLWVRQRMWPHKRAVVEAGSRLGAGSDG